MGITVCLEILFLARGMKRMGQISGNEIAEVCEMGILSMVKW